MSNFDIDVFNGSMDDITLEFGADGQPIIPLMVLSTKSERKIGAITNAQHFKYKHYLNAPDEISFQVSQYQDGHLCAVWNQLTNFKNLYIPTWKKWFELYVDINQSSTTEKQITGVSLLESELAQIRLYDIEINTERDISREDYEVSTIYNEDNKKASIIDRLLEKAPHYTILHVDQSIAKLQRSFSFNNTSIIDAFNEIADEIHCLFIYGESDGSSGKISRTISIYDLESYCPACNYRGDFLKSCPKCGSTNIYQGYGEDTTIFLSAENLAKEINYSTNTDAVKNCFRLEAGDDLMTATIRNCNPNGSQYLWYISTELRKDMSKELQDKLSAYDELSIHYNNEYELTLSPSLVNQYNTLVTKYQSYNPDIHQIKLPILGFSNLMNLYYDTIDFYGILSNTLMPSPEFKDTTAQEQAALLSASNLSPIAVQDLSKLSLATANSALLAYAKVWIDNSKYKVSVSQSSLDLTTWTGNFLVESYTDENDTATSQVIKISFNDDLETYIQQKLDKALSKDDNQDYGIVKLFKLDNTAIRNELKKHCLSNLKLFEESCQACLDILIDNGVADQDLWIDHENNLYNNLYVTYREKLSIIKSERLTREEELKIIKRSSDDDPLGVQDEIEKQKRFISQALDFQSFIGDPLWVEFIAFRREDTYTNSNYISDGLSNSELIKNALQFIEAAQKEIIKSATLQHSISSPLKDLLVIPEFKPLATNFKCGNWMRYEVDSGIYKLRLISYSIDFDDLDNLDVEFSDVTTAADVISDIEDILSQAKNMATSYPATEHQAEKGQTVSEFISGWVNNGLDLTTTKIINDANNQNVVYDKNGLLCRRYDDIENSYDDEQVKIINKGLYFTKDNWKTAKAGIGEFLYLDPRDNLWKTGYGVIADTIVGNVILGEEVGIYNESGSVKIDKDGFTVTADANDTNPNLFTLQRRNEDGSYTKYIYVDDDGNIKINGKHIQMTTSEDLGSYIDSTIKQEAAALVIQLSNDYVGISTDADGNGGDFSNCYVDVKAFSGSTDITKSGDVEWTISPTSGVVGEWDAQNFRYTVTGLNTNIGEVVFDVEYNGLNVSKSFRISKIKDGRKGETGLDGKDGEDGTSNFIHIKYSPVANPTDDLMTETPSTYIGVCVDENLADPTTADSYTWSRFRGNDGQDGTPGTDGEDGVSTYVHFAYAQSSDGSLNFSITEYDGATYLGVYTDTIEADSTDYTKYAWSLIKGADGESISILSTEVAYIPSDDGVNPPNAYSLATNDGNIIVNEDGDEITTHKWLTEIPYVVAGSYLWTRTTVNYSDGTSTVTYSVSRQGIDGTDGTDGLDGKDGKDGSSNYIHIKYSAYPNPTDDQISEIPSDYIGVCVNESLQDPESASSYTWSKFKGSDGTDGIPGKDCYVHFAYATSADGSQGFSKTEFTGAIYIGVYSDNTKADSDDYHDYAWSKIKGDDGKDGLPGKDGEDGKSSYIHIKYSSVASPSDEQMTEIPSAYIGVYVDYTEEDSDTASDYTWSRWQGKDGADGIDAKDAYVHFAYSTSSDGSENFSVTEFEEATYLGVYSDREQADSTDHTKYAWSKIKGKDVTIVSTKIEYIATTEKSTTPPESIELVDSSGKSLIDNSGNVFVTNKWSNEIPDLTDGSYLWTRTTVNYSDGNSTVTYTNAKQGDTGDAGRNYFLEMDATAVKIDGNNIITPDKLIVKGYYRDGNGDREVYPCRFVITKTYKSKLTETVLTTSSNVAEQSFDIYGEAEMPEFYTVEMHKAGQQPTEDNLLDIQTIPILVDSANMMIGARNLLKLSDKLEGCHYYGNTGVYSITEDEIDAKQVVKVQAASGSNTAKAVYYEIYTDNLIASEAGTKLTASMNVFARQNGTLNVCLANPNGVMKTTDEQQITLMPGWNKVYTVLTIQDTEFELVTDIRDSFVTSNNLTITTGDVGILSNVLRITDNMNSGDYYAIDYIQLEKGNRPTDAYPAPEDLTNYTDEMLSGMSDELKGIISDVLNQVIANKEEFDELTSETGQIEEIRRSSVDTQQHVDRLETNVDTYILKVDTVEGKVVDIEKTTECFSMEDAGLRITRKISGQPSSQQLSMLLSEQKLSFYQGTDEVAYFSNNKLYVTDAEILDKLQLGKFAFIPRSNGNLSFRYLGT